MYARMSEKCQNYLIQFKTINLATEQAGAKPNQVKKNLKMTNDQKLA